MKISIVTILVSCLLASCTSIGPHEVESRYAMLARQNNQAEMEKLYTVDSRAAADEAWIGGKSSMTHLVFVGGQWKIACSTYGAPKSDGARLTLIEAIRSIQGNDFESLRRYLPIQESSDAAFDENQKDYLKAVVSQLEPHLCRPFEINDNIYSLRYSSNPAKEVRLEKQGTRWVITEWD